MAAVPNTQPRLRRERVCKYEHTNKTRKSAPNIRAVQTRQSHCTVNIAMAGGDRGWMAGRVLKEGCGSARERKCGGFRRPQLASQPLFHHAPTGLYHMMPLPALTLSPDRGGSIINPVDY
eukprot:6556165-Prymnesium_polylepis.1